MTPSFFGVVVLVFALGVQDVGVLRRAVRYADEELIGGGSGSGYGGGEEGGGVGVEGGDEDGAHC